MSQRFPTLTIAALAAVFAAPSMAAAQVNTPAADGNATASIAAPADGDALLAQAREAATSASLTARLRYQCDLFGRRLIGTGGYAQGSADPPQFRLELRLQFPDFVATLQQICDGEHLWIRREMHGHKPPLETVNLRQVLYEQQNRPSAAASEINGLKWASLPQLFDGLAAGFHFVTYGVHAVDGIQVHALEGKWRPAALANLYPEAREAIANGSAQPDLAKLPEHVPDQVFVLLRVNDLFPYRVEYRRTRRERSIVGLSRDVTTTLMRLEFYDVARGATVEPATFQFTPGDEPIIDRTAEVIAKLPP